MKIYLATRLYNTNDKLRACHLEECLNKAYSNADVFMPYRDVNEDAITSDWKQTIFNNDIKHLSKSDLLIGFWDGTEFDEGIGFEIGYAIAKGIPVIVLNSDFIEYYFLRSSKQYRLPDPIFMHLGIVLNKEIFKMAGKDTYSKDLKKSISLHMSSIKNSIVYKNKPIFYKRKSKYSCFIDTGASVLTAQAVKPFIKEGGYLSARYFSEDIKSSSYEDLDALLSSDEVYLVAHWPEMNSGSSVMAGICFALSIPFYVINDRTVGMLGMQNEKMPVNLMIDVACHGYREIGEICS